MRFLFRLALLLPAAAIAQPSMPSWLAPYPGAAAQTKSFSSYVESAYIAAAKPAAVEAHYQKLFELAGLAVRSGFDGSGTAIRGAAPECDLLIKIREDAAGSLVRVSCAQKTPEMRAVSSLPPPPPPPPQNVLDDPDPPGARRVRVAPAWPGWLVHPAGAAMSIDRAAGRADAPFLASRFDTISERSVVHSFYSDLFEAQRCAIASQGKAWLECSYRPDARFTTRLIIRAELAPIASGTHVELRVTTLP